MRSSEETFVMEEGELVLPAAAETEHLPARSLDGDVSQAGSLAQDPSYRLIFRVDKQLAALEREMRERTGEDSESLLLVQDARASLFELARQFPQHVAPRSTRFIGAALQRARARRGS